VNAAVGDHQPDALVPADSAAFSSGDSKEGVEQLIGNAREWTATRVHVNTHSKTGRPLVMQGTWNGHDRVAAVGIVGHGYDDNAATVQDSLEPVDPTTADDQTGFRCVTPA
jgi:formylglycine-generating enzyme required for sulfatase activity